MAFDFPSVATEKRKAKEKNKKPITTKGNTVKEEKEDQKFAKTLKPILGKKEGIKKELAIIQLDDALSRTKNSDKISNKGLENVINAAADDSQLERSERRLMRMMSKGGRAGYKNAGSVKGCKMATKGKGRAYGKNS